MLALSPTKKFIEQPTKHQSREHTTKNGASLSSSLICRDLRTIVHPVFAHRVGSYEQITAI